MLTLSKGHGFLSRVGMKMGTYFSHYLKNIFTSLPSLGLDRVVDSQKHAQFSEARPETDRLF